MNVQSDSIREASQLLDTTDDLTNRVKETKKNPPSLRDGTAN